jgi:hypothetical protein
MRLTAVVFASLLITVAGPATAQAVRATAIPRVVAGTVAAPVVGSGPRIPAPLSRSRRMQLTGGTDGSVFASLSIASPLVPDRAFLELVRPAEVLTWGCASCDAPRAHMGAGPQSWVRVMAKPTAATTFLVDCQVSMPSDAQLQVTPALSSSAAGAVQNYSAAQLQNGHLLFLLQTVPAGWAQVSIGGTAPWTLYGCELRTI